MLFRANQMPPVLSTNSSVIPQTMPPASSNPINPINSMGMSNHFPVSQDVDLRMGKFNFLILKNDGH